MHLLNPKVVVVLACLGGLVLQLTTPWRQQQRSDLATSLELQKYYPTFPGRRLQSSKQLSRCPQLSLFPLPGTLQAGPSTTSTTTKLLITRPPIILQNAA